MATDGLLNFWLVKIDNEEIKLKKIFIDDNESYSLHQSGINSFDIKSMGNGEYLLGTGGDDSLLSLIRFQILTNDNCDTQIKIVWTWKSYSSHTGQITGI